MDYWIKANSEKQYKFLEEGYLQFKKEYILHGNNLINLLIKGEQIFPDLIIICPDNKCGEINSIKINPNNEVKGRITESNENGWKILIDNKRYVVEKINPDFKEEK
ncbi:MAG: hypothetical protein M1416_03170 [Candidatus Pacearchaeota archaeon]|nr:hypothetical protein [Candidatus Pacearchaeota archaeon]